jgi:hypothetical protein
MQLEVILLVAGFIITLLTGLLLIIGYFLKELHSDFKALKEAVMELVEQAARNEEKGKSGYRLLDQRLEDLGQRVERLEDRFTT